MWVAVVAFIGRVTNFNPRLGELEMFKFADWQLSNVKKFGLQFPLDQEFTITAVELEAEFAKVRAVDVNPESAAIENHGKCSLGVAWYEWLADCVAGQSEMSIVQEFEMGAHLFALDFPQLKMRVVSMRPTRVFQEFFHDGVEFTVVFYS